MYAGDEYEGDDVTSPTDWDGWDGRWDEGYYPDDEEGDDK